MAAAFAAVNAAGSCMRDQRVVIHGAGTAGLGIADLMRDEWFDKASRGRTRPAVFGRWGGAGLLTDDRTEHQFDFPAPLRVAGR